LFGRVRRGVVTGIGAFAFVALLGLVWQGAIVVFAIPSFLLPTPVQVANAAIAERWILFSAAMTTVGEAAVGFLLGNAIGLLAAFAAAAWLTAARIALPIALAVRSAPIIALTPILTLVFGFGFRTTAVIVALIVFFPALVNGVLGLRSVSPNVLEYMHVIDAPESVVLQRVRIPAALPSIFAAFRIGSVSSILGAMVAEWVTTGGGLGYLILKSGVSFELALMWAGVLASVALAVVALAATSWLERRVIAWQPLG
jgi:ABC-type nitrate/sulfonate/bicarbonate transport system permease component